MECPTLAIAINKLDNSQKTLEIIEFLEQTSLNCFLFYSELADFPISIKQVILPIKEMYTFDGVVISTCLDTTQKLLRSFRPKIKIFYSYELEWATTLLDYNIVYDIYCNNDIDLVCRSEIDKNIIENCWKECFNLEELTDDNIRRFFYQKR